MLILDVKPKLDCGMIDSGIIFDHNEVTSMCSINTCVYIANLSGGRILRSNEQTVKGLAAATTTNTTPTDINGGCATSKTPTSGGSHDGTRAAKLSGKGAGKILRGLLHQPV